MTDIELKAIEDRAAKATPGVWTWAQDSRPAHWFRKLLVTKAAWWAKSAADAEFIAHARTDVPALVAEVRRLQNENQKKTA